MNPVSLLRWGLLLCLLIESQNANGIQKPDREGLPNLDRRKSQSQAVLHKKNDEAELHLREGLPMAKVDYDAIIGGPKWVSSPDGFLTGMHATGRGISAKTAAAFPANELHRATKAFLREHSNLFHHGPVVLKDAKIKREFVTQQNGMRTVVWEQQHNGIPVFEALLISHTTKDEELVNISSHFLPDPAQAAKTGARNQKEQAATPEISAEAAIVIAAKNVGEDIAISQIKAIDSPADAEKKQRFRAARLTGETEATLVWLPMNDMEMRLCWGIVLTSRARGEMFRILVDTQTGEVLVRHCLTSYISNASYRVYTSDSPSPFSPGYSTPISTLPPFVQRQLIVTNAFNTTASPNGWIDDGVNETRGNNVDAHLDLNADDIADTPRPQGSPFRVFDFPVEPKDNALNYSNAAVVQVFFLCNWYHDKLYELGFTEAAGNFQVNNFGRGGLGNDPIQADALDGSGYNNANFSTPADGASGRMQMYFFTGDPIRDGDMDAEIVFHEATHGLSNRRVGGGVGISAFQPAGMGEGWSDFYALCLLAQPGDDINGNYAAGGYATRDYYFGIRRYPYTTDLTKNPLTFKDIDPNQASAHAGIPRNPTWGSSSPSEVHNQGEVWCIALWEVRAKLINKYGFAGNNLALQLVTDGMNLSPANPSFVQARDAIIQADLVDNGGANANEIWAGFAKRGLGFLAVAPDVSITDGVIESFALPDALRISPQTRFTSVGPVNGPFVPTQQSLTLTNVGTNSVSWSAGPSATWLSLSSSNGTLSPGAASATLNVIVNPTANLLPAGIYNATVHFTNVSSGFAQDRLVVLQVGQPDHFTEIFAGDNDLAFQTFTFTPDGSTNFYSVCRNSAAAFPTDPSGGTSVSLTDDSYAQVTISGTNRVSLYGISDNVFYIGSNGYITFGYGDTSRADVTVHFSRLRISGFMDNLLPSAGQVTWKQLSDRVAVTFANVREFATANTNSFQIEMFFNGVIRITYLRMDARSGVVGLSQGNGWIPATFIESDFSAYASCGAPLTLVLPDHATEGNGVLIGQGSVSITFPVSTNVSVNLSSSDTSELIVPAAATILAGATSAAFNLTVVDDSVRDGIQRPIVSASAPGFVTAVRSMSIFDNETATLTVVLPPNVTEGDANVQGVVSVNQTPDESIVVSLVSSVPAVAQPSSSFVIIPAGQTSAVFTVIAPRNDTIGSDQSVAITAHVDGWTDGVAPLTIHEFFSKQLLINLGLYGDGQFREGMTLYSSTTLVSIAAPLPTNLTVTLASDDTTEITVQPSVTIPAGSTSAYFDLTIIDDNLLDGTQVVHLTASAPGFITASNTVTVSDNETPLGPYSFSPENLSSNNPASVDLTWYTSETGVYDVYFGTNATLGPTNLLGSTTNNSWGLPTLIPFTTYYWRVDSRVLGQTNGPTMQFSTIPEATINDVSVLEGNSGVTNAVFTVTLLQPSPQPVKVSFDVSSNGEDYGSTNGTLIFAPGQTNKSFSVPVYGDTAYELDESYYVNLSSPDTSAYILNYGTLTIRNDDVLPGFAKYYLDPYIAAESCAPNGVIDPNEVVTVNFYLSNNSQTNTTNLVVTLQATNGVTVLSAPQNFGNVGSGSMIEIPFTFMVNGSCGSNFQAVLSLADGTADLGKFYFPFTLGKQVLVTHTNIFSSPNPIVIPDFGNAVPFPSSNVVSGLTGTVEKVTVTLSNLNHTFPADVDVLLVGPDNQGVGLMGNAGAGFDVTNVTLTFDSDATTQLPASSQIVSGTYYPFYSSFPVTWDITGQTTFSYTLGGFHGINPNGAWRLFVYDDSADDSGSIAGGWTLSIVTTDGSVTYSCCDFPPTISTITNQSTPEDRPTAAIPFSIGDFEKGPDTLLVTASSSNTNLVPNSNIVLGGSGSNRVVTLTPATNQFGTTTITIYVSDDKATTSNSFVLTVTPVNDPPVLTAIPNRTVVEGTLLSFTNTATDVESVNPVVIADFESAANGTANGSYLFLQPTSSGSTSAFLDPSPNLDTVTNNFPAGHASTKALLVNFSFKTGTVNPWLRLTTFNAASLPNPTIPFNQMLKFDIYSDKDLKVALGLRETSTTAAIGANGGTTGSIEFVGVSGSSGGAPVPTRTVSASNWTTLTFQIPAEPLAAFTGNGILDSTTGKGVLEHLALVPAGGLGAYKVYLDNFNVVSNVIIYSLDPGAPAGATINPATGVFQWIPTEAQGPGVYSITVRATDLGTPPLNDTKTFTVTVLETNGAPVLSLITNRTIYEGTTLAITNIATDPDIPTNSLTFALDPIIPAGAGINPTTGVFSFTPSAAQLGVNSFTVRVTDNGIPNMNDTKNFSVTVVPKPTVQITTGQGSVTVAWPAITGNSYRIQFKNTLNDSDWTDLFPNILATNSTAALVITPDQSQRYYRLLLLP